MGYGEDMTSATQNLSEWDQGTLAYARKCARKGMPGAPLINFPFISQPDLRRLADIGVADIVAVTKPSPLTGEARTLHYLVAK